MDFTPAEARTIKRAHGILAKHLRQAGDVLSRPQQVREFLRLLLAGEQREIFVIVCLDAHNRLILADPLFAGTISQTSVHPREVVKAVLARNASAVIGAHNHPSGVAEPSQAD